MKRNFLYGLIILIVLGAIFSILHFGYNWFAGCPKDFDLKGDIAKGDIHIISFGLPSDTWQQTQIVAKEYGFYYQNRGCVVTHTEMKCADNYNEKVVAYLAKRNGEGWFERFKKSVDSLEATSKEF